MAKSVGDQIQSCSQRLAQIESFLEGNLPTGETRRNLEQIAAEVEVLGRSVTKSDRPVFSKVQEKVHSLSERARFIPDFSFLNTDDSGLFGNSSPSSKPVPKSLACEINTMKRSLRRQSESSGSLLFPSVEELSRQSQLKEEEGTSKVTPFPPDKELKRNGYYDPSRRENSPLPVATPARSVQKLTFPNLKELLEGREVASLPTTSDKQRVQISKTPEVRSAPVSLPSIRTLKGSRGQRVGNTCPSNASNFLRHVFQNGISGTTKHTLDEILTEGEVFFDDVLMPMRKDQIKKLSLEAAQETATNYSQEEMQLFRAEVASLENTKNALSTSEIQKRKQQIQQEAQAEGQKVYVDTLRQHSLGLSQIPADSVLSAYKEAYKTVFYQGPIQSPNSHTLSADQSTRIAHYKGQFEALVNLLGRGSKAAGATVTCNGGTYAMAVEKDAKDHIQYLIYDSHGTARVFKTDNIDLAASALEQVVPYSAFSLGSRSQTHTPNQVGYCYQMSQR